MSHFFSLFYICVIIIFGTIVSFSFYAFASMQSIVYVLKYTSSTGVETVPPSKSSLVFSRCPKMPPLILQLVVFPSLTVGSIHQQPLFLTDLDLVIVLRRGKCSSSAHPIFQIAFYDKLYLYFCQFSFFFSLYLCHFRRLCLYQLGSRLWIKEIQALVSQLTQDLVNAPLGSSIVGCRWAYTMKFKPNGYNDRYKACFAAKDFFKCNGIILRRSFLWLHSTCRYA